MGIRNIQLPTNLGFNTPEIKDITDDLPHNPNYTWKELTGERDINDLQIIVLHHSGVPKSAGADAYRHAQNHINGHAYEPKGEPGLPYHGYVKDGQAYQTNDLLDFTYGVASHNQNTVHLCVEGDYANSDTLTDPDRLALYGLVLAVKAQLPNFQEIKAHCELNPTSCPGYDYNQVREDIAQLELKMKAAADPDAIMAKCFNSTNQHAWLYGEYKKDPVANKWMEAWLLELHDLMQKRGMFFDS